MSDIEDTDTENGSGGLENITNNSSSGHREPKMVRTFEVVYKDPETGSPGLTFIQTGIIMVTGAFVGTCDAEGFVQAVFPLENLHHVREVDASTPVSP